MYRPWLLRGPASPILVVGAMMALLSAACSGDTDTALITDGPTSTIGEVVAGPGEVADGATEPSETPSKLTVADGEAVPITSPRHVGPAPKQPGQVDGADGARPAPAGDVDQPDLGEPDEIVAEIHESMEGQTVSGAEVLDAIEPLDEKPTSAEVQEVRDRRDGVGDAPATDRFNEAGELDRLDEAAALACADIERALTAIDESDVKKAVEAIDSAATRAGESGIDDIAAWSEPLEGAWSGGGDDPAVLLGFLSSCTKGGYEL